MSRSKSRGHSEKNEIAKEAEEEEEDEEEEEEERGRGGSKVDYLEIVSVYTLSSNTDRKSVV